jgi:hypothetical protein
MADYILNHFELSQYGLLRSQVIKLDESIKEAEDELAELNKYNMSISSVLTGMPSGNEKRDKIADYLVKLEADRQRVSSTLTFLAAERDVIKYRLHRIRGAVNKITDKQLQDIIIWHYFDGLSIGDVAEKSFTSASSVYRKINKILKCEVL